MGAGRTGRVLQEAARDGIQSRADAEGIAEGGREADRCAESGGPGESKIDRQRRGVLLELRRTRNGVRWMYDKKKRLVDTEGMHCTVLYGWGIRQTWFRGRFTATHSRKSSAKIFTIRSPEEPAISPTGCSHS